MTRIGLVLLFLAFTLFVNAQHVTDRCGESYVIEGGCLARQVPDQGESCADAMG